MATVISIRNEFNEGVAVCAQFIIIHAYTLDELLIVIKYANLTLKMDSKVKCQDQK